MDEKVYELLNKLNIEYEVFKHQPLFTCEDVKMCDLKLDGLDCKNLFVRNDKKTKYYLISLPAEKQVNIKQIAQCLKEKRFSFASDTDLQNILKVQSGSVSMFNLINCIDERVKYIIDNDILKNDKVCFHPNTNDKTIILNSKDINIILDELNIKYIAIDIA